MSGPSIFETLAQYGVPVGQLARYNGPFSHFDEWHAACIGVLIGLAWQVLPAMAYVVAAVAVGAVGLQAEKHLDGLATEDLPFAMTILKQMPPWMRRQLVDEPHYFAAGVVVGLAYLPSTYATQALSLVPV
jgi:hypothetical protein